MCILCTAPLVVLPAESQTHLSTLSCCWAGRVEPSLSPISYQPALWLGLTAVAMVISTCQLRRHDNVIGWQHPDRLDGVVSTKLKCTTGSSDWWTDSWFKNSCRSAAANWWCSCRFWVTGAVICCGKVALYHVFNFRFKVIQPFHKDTVCFLTACEIWQPYWFSHPLPSVCESWCTSITTWHTVQFCVDCSEKGRIIIIQEEYVVYPQK